MPLLAPDVHRIAPESTDPDTGPAPEWIAAATPRPLLSRLESLLGADRVLSRALDLIRYASDASPYRLFPKAVVEAHDADDVSKVLRLGREHGIPVTLR
jgi:D-lactate dehydrogenase